jgi:enediyne biosynthesis protein E4
MMPSDKSKHKCFTKNKVYCMLLAFSWLSQACQTPESTMAFELLASSKTGIDFNNEIVESDSLNILKFEYLYNGAGVGIGDFNNDGQQDIFFAGNKVSSRLYLNKGDFDFEDATEASKVTTNRWCTGVAIVDINQDGWDDIYISTIHPDKTKTARNLFYINKGIVENEVPVFEELAGSMGLADSSYSTQVAFLDYDLDGDLDMYLVNNALEDFSRNTPYGQREDGTGKSVDRLFRNNGNGISGLPQFTDVSKEANIVVEGWGLGIIVNDFNQDGYPDVYVTNDFLSNDHLYINNQDGTFTNQISNYLKHQEHNGMGVDAADINNDGFNEIVGVDMMPNDNLRQKTMFSNIGYDRFWLNRQRGYQDQYVRNVLQFNNGNNTFSDIGYMSGMYCTDWSWSALLADYDNDGHRDLLITNGYPKDVTDLDFTTYASGSNMFGTPEARLAKAMQAIDKLVGIKKPNFIFKNNNDLTFTNQAKAWGLDRPSYTNGAAYADLDNDGDLDLVMNNINDKAFIYRNKLCRKNNNEANFLRLQLITIKGKSNALGTKVKVYSKSQFQYAEQQQQRGYKSSVEPYMHFGLGEITIIDSLVVAWPAGNQQVLKNIAVNQVIKVYESNAIVSTKVIKKKNTKIFEEVHKTLNVFYKHEEGLAIDFKEGQALLPQMHSKLGPGVAVGDVNSDGLEDFIIGGTAGKSAVIFYQQTVGVFKSTQLPSKKMEDMGMLLFDADADGDLDLYCASGSSEFGRTADNYQHRFYRNLGKENFFMDTTALPKIKSSASCVIANDFDKDGDLDLFVGGRVVPLKYPSPPESHLLRNDGKGNFSNATVAIAPSLQFVGMVTSALWSDFDNDGFTDLIMVGEWMPINIFKNIGGKKFEHLSPKNLAHTTGWWNSLVGGDFDSDGDTDYIAGNLGLNSIFQASEKEPVSIYASDYDGNGSFDPIISRFIEGVEYPTHYRETITDQMSFLRRSLLRYSVYGKATLQNFIPADKLEEALIYKATYFKSAYIENAGNGNFKIKPLPIEVQTTPVYGMVVTDLNSDGNVDVMAIGNSYSSETASGLYDAGIGVVLQGDGKGNFSSIHVNNSGFFVDNDAKGFAELKISKNKSLWIVTTNSDSTKVFMQTDLQKQTVLSINRDDAYAEIIFEDGKKQKQEFYFGSGYLSQSSRSFTIPTRASEIYIVNVHGIKRKVF